MARARQGNNVKRSLKTFIIGEQGSRKSGTAVDIAKLIREDGKPMRVLYIDIENGSIDGFHLDRLEDEGVDLRNIYIVYTNEYKEVEDYCQRFIKGSYFYEIEEVIGEDGEIEFEEAIDNIDKVIRDADGEIFIPDAIVIDGVTVLGEDVKFSAIEISEERAYVRAELQEKNTREKRVAIETAGLEFKDHDKIKMKGVKLIGDLIRSTPKHVILTGRSKEESVMKKGSKGEMVLTPTGRSIPEHWKWIGYEVHTYIHQWIDNETGESFGKILNKDRTGMYKHNEVIKNPSMAKFQPVIERNKGLRDNNFLTQDSFDKTLEKNKDTIRNKIESSEPVELDNNKIIDSILEEIEDMSVIKKSTLKAKLKENGIKASDISKDNINIDIAKKIRNIIDNI